MGIDTKGFVVAELDIWTIVDCIKKGMKDYTTTNWLNKKPFKTNTLARTELYSFGKGFTHNFKDGEDQRLLHCSIDNEDYRDIIAGKKITFILGYWGNSVKIMTDILTEFKQFGPTYIQEEDATTDFRVL